jgi:hypothetical protein
VPDLVLDTSAGLFLVEAKQYLSDEDRWYIAMRLSGSCSSGGTRPSFVVVGDLERIQFYQPGGTPRLLASLHTREVLRVYDDEYDRKTIYESYLLGLIEAWLNDLGSHWRDGSPPPGAERLPQEVLQALAA